jgi:hypothetical protein
VGATTWLAPLRATPPRPARRAAFDASIASCDTPGLGRGIGFPALVASLWGPPLLLDPLLLEPLLLDDLLLDDFEMDDFELEPPLPLGAPR